MRTTLRVLAIASVAAVPAVATATYERPIKKHMREKCKPMPRAGVAYIVKGVLTEDATNTSFTIAVNGGNRFGREAVKAAETRTITVELGRCTRIAKVMRHKRHGRRMRHQGWMRLKTGDRVLVKWRAKKGTALEDLGPARRVVELGARHSR